MHTYDRVTATPVTDRAERLASLRGLLAEKFPACELKAPGILPTGLAALDATEGGLRRGALTELTGTMSGGGFFLEATLTMLARERCFGALVDAANSYDPQGTEPSLLARLLWVRGGGSLTGVKAADLLMRDGNFALVILDLQCLPMREVQRIPASTWHRFQRLAEQGSAAFVVMTRHPLVEGAQVRIAVPHRWTLAAMRERRRHLLEKLPAQVFARRHLPTMVDFKRASA